MAIVISGTTGIDAGSLPVANTGKISAGSGLPVILNTAGVDRVTVDTAGNVGIGTGSNINAKLDVQGSIRQYNPGTTANTVINHVNDAKNWYVGLRGDSSNVYSIADETRQRLILDTTGNTLHLSPLGGLGYGAGAGGAVTQLTSKSTAVTLNKPTGSIVTNNSALAAGQEVTFTVYNNLIGNDDNIVISPSHFSEPYNIRAKQQIGQFNIIIKNISDITKSDNILLQFAIIKGAVA